jgi:hypothetical protein
MVLIYALVFVYTLLAGFAIQEVVLPDLFPNLHAGHGLLKGGDSVGFHAMAVAAAEQIRLHGWSAWELRPSGHAPVGIAAVLYAATGIHEPWIALPFNAALFALIAAAMFGITYSLTNNVAAAVAAIVPLLLFPSAAMIYGDLHKDVIAGAGSILIIFIWTRIAATDDISWSDAVYFILFCLFATALVWIVRPYFVKVLLFVSILIGIVIGLMDLVRWRTSFAMRSPRRFIAFVGCLAVLTLVMKIPVTGSAYIGSSSDGPIQTVHWTQWTPSWSSAVSSPLEAFETSLQSIAYARTGFLTTYPDAGSMIDSDVMFHSSVDIVHYIPRALQIGLFAPFPTMWFTEGANAAARVMRAVTGIEMAICYILLAGVILAIPLLNTKGLRIGVVAVVSCLVIITLLSLSVPNVGTLYRLRFPFLMLPVGLGAAGWTVVITHLYSIARLRRSKDHDIASAAARQAP